MGRPILAISAAITAFVLATTAGAVSAVRSLSAKPSTASAPSSTGAGTTLELVDVPALAAAADISPQDAASTAAKYLGHTDLYSVELADFEGAQVYKVTFSSGDVVYVGMTGDVLSAVPPPPPAVLTVITGGGGGHHQGSGEGDRSSDSGEHDGQHEGGDD